MVTHGVASTVMSSVSGVVVGSTWTGLAVDTWPMLAYVSRWSRRAPWRPSRDLARVARGLVTVATQPPRPTRRPLPWPGDVDGPAHRPLRADHAPGGPGERDGAPAL